MNMSGNKFIVILHNSLTDLAKLFDIQYRISLSLSLLSWDVVHLHIVLDQVVRSNFAVAPRTQNISSVMHLHIEKGGFILNLYDPFPNLIKKNKNGLIFSIVFKTFLNRLLFFLFFFAIYRANVPAQGSQGREILVALGAHAAHVS